MPDAVELMKLIKKAAIQAVEASKPVQICFGLVKSTKPLKIYVDQKMTLGEKQLMLSRNVSGGASPATTGSVTEYAKSFVGKIPYLYGAGRNYNTLEEIVAAGGMCDCSAFTERVYRHFGAEIGTVVSIQESAGTAVSISQIQDGDLHIHEGGDDYTGNVKISPLSAFTLTGIRRIAVNTSSQEKPASESGLAKNDEVILIRQQGGQKYIVIGKVL